MLKKLNNNRWTWFAGLLSLLAVTFTSRAADPYYYAVQASATVSTSPARISLTWPADPAATGYTISRKAFGATSWSQVATLAGNATSWSDSNVAIGGSYEYSFAKSTSGGYSGTGYVYAGINAPLVDTRGRVMLVVDNTYASQLSMELSRFEQDLIGDGWTVVRQNVNRTDSPVTVKNYIKNAYNNGGLRSVILFGHVAVPYSGNIYPDGHGPGQGDHQGAWPADVYYGDMDGTWTDSSVNVTSAAKSWNWNTPGDGKFDQNTIPSDVELEVGRIDLSNMTCYSNKNPSRGEVDLLRQYLNKDNNFRHGRLDVQRRATVCDNFGVPYGEAFAAAGWRLGSAFFGAANTTVTPGNQYFPNLSQNSYLFAYACGGGSFYTCAGVGGADDFATTDVKAVFTLFLGSFFADWDNESNFMRASLGSGNVLTTGWSGRPEWWLHHMALGETIGYGTRLTQNNQGLYNPQYQSTRGVHIGLLGDPTLRLHPVKPVSSLVASAVGSVVTLTWTPSTDSNIVGYHIYRATSANGPYTRLTSSPQATANYVDSSAPAGAVYMVRAIKLETSGSGVYHNASQGIFSNSGSTGGTGTIPSAPSNLSAASAGSSSITVNWSDTSGNETGFKVERKTGAAGTYGTINTTAANATSYSDSGLTAGTQYFYRLSAINTTGASGTVETSASTAALSGGAATATFVNVDTSASGTWKGVYGSEGAYLAGDASTVPAYGLITPPSAPAWTWGYSTIDARALQRVNNPDRIAACLNVDGTFNVGLNIADGQAHRVALYFLDWDNHSRSQTVEIVDANTGVVLHTQTLSAFGNGKYLVYDLKGNITIRLTKLTGDNAVLSGIFFGPASTTTGGGEITKTATAQKTASAVNLIITGTVGQAFKVYSSADLINWDAGTLVTLTSTVQNYIDTSIGGATKKFYRAVPQ